MDGEGSERVGRAPLPPQPQPARDRSQTNGVSGREHAEQIRSPPPAKLRSEGAAGGFAERFGAPLPPFSSGAAAAGSASASASLLAAIPESPAQNAAGVAAKERGRLLCGRGRSLTHQLAALLDVFVCANSVVIVPLINLVCFTHFAFFYKFFMLICVTGCSWLTNPRPSYSALFISKDGKWQL